MWRHRAFWLFVLAAVAGVVGVAGLPQIALNAVTNTLVMVLFATAYGFAAGQAGLLSFGHAAYFGAGAFATVHVLRAVAAGSLALPLPLPLVPLAGGAVAFAFGLGAGYFATLRTGIYFSMITLAIADLVLSMAPVMEGVFGGEGGLSGNRYPWLGVTFYTDRQTLGLVTVWTLVSLGLLYYVTLTPFGRLVVAVSQNEKRVAALGFNVRSVKTLAFAISCLFSGVAGSLFALSMEQANYTLFGLEYSANVVLATFIGGAGLYLGPALGAALLSVIHYVVSSYTHLWALYQGLMFVAVMLFAPAGLLAFLRAEVRRERDEAWTATLRRVGRLAGILVVAAAALVVVEQLVSGRLEPIGLSKEWLSVGLALAAGALLLRGAPWRRRETQP